ncbi:MAG: ribonuclease R [Oscillospiraceae bacterium]|nr:ribonuclease R [Oscillospiraceae bacterium]
MKNDQNMKKQDNRPRRPGQRPAARPDFKKEITRVLERAGSRGASMKYLQEQAGIRRHQVEAFLLALAGMVKSGTVQQKRERYYKDAQAQTAEGVVVKVAERFGFVRPDEAQEDVFIPGRYLMGALPGDRVKVTVRQGRGNLKEGEVLAILEEIDYHFTGVFRVEDGLAVVYPDSQLKGPVTVAKNETGDAKEGDKVSARIVKRGRGHLDHRAAVTAVFGSSQRADVCCQAILADNGIVKEFPSQVLEEARRIQEKGISQQEMDGRLDLRDQIIFTIDGADTKDIDDAISLTRLEDGWELGVHIADVSHYVLPQSVLDEEAFGRGTSVYYANSVIPMLPQELSNGICSLNPMEERLAFSALMHLDQEGALSSYEFHKTVIRSRVKGVYSEVNRIFDGTADEAIHQKYDGLEPTLLAMKELAELLARRRLAQGSLDLESTEAKIVIGEDGRVQDILPRATGESERMIESFMLTANEAAATFGLERELPFLFRIHEDPSAEKLEALSALLTVLGLDTSEVKPGVRPAQLQKILHAVKGTDMQMLVNSQLLRSMAKAKYSEVNKGHFGLVLDKYSHFTSPIRRYPDLAIHRIMSEALKGMDTPEAQRRFGKFVQDAAAHSSATEQRAMSVERSCEDCYKAEYMTGHLGECYEGIVSGVIERGIFVELPNTVEGMIRISEMPGNFEYDGKIEVKDTVSGRHFRIGDRIPVKVARADVSSGDVDFTLEEAEV